jgi:hypothetical protein
MLLNLVLLVFILPHNLFPNGLVHIWKPSIDIVINVGQECPELWAFYKPKWERAGRNKPYVQYFELVRVNRISGLIVKPTAFAGIFFCYSTSLFKDRLYCCHFSYLQGSFWQTVAVRRRVHKMFCRSHSIPRTGICSVTMFTTPFFFSGPQIVVSCLYLLVWHIREDL